MEAALAEVTRVRQLHEDLNNPESASKLAQSLNNLAEVLNRVGRHEEALLAGLEALELSQVDIAIAEDRKVYQSKLISVDLAKNYRDQGRKLSALGRYEEACQARREAVDLYRNLYIDKPDTYADELALCLLDLRLTLAELGQHAVALQVIQEQANVYRHLYKKKPMAYGKKLATTLMDLNVECLALGRREEAMQAGQAAVNINRDLFRSHPDGFDALNLAKSFANFGSAQYQLGETNKALITTRKAVTLFRYLHKKSRTEIFNGLAESLSILGSIYFSQGNATEAGKALQEAVDLYRSLVPRWSKPDYRVELAASLVRLGHHRASRGQNFSAIRLTQRGVQILRSLHNKGRSNHAELLAHSLHLLGAVYDLVGKRQKATVYWSEAGECLVNNAVMNPRHWCEILSGISPKLDSANSLRKVHLVALKRIADLRRIPHFDSLAGSAFIELQAVLVTDLWKKLNSASEEDAELMNDTLPMLLSSLQSPDLMRWLAANRNSTTEGRALAQAESEYFQAAAALAQLNERLHGGRGSSDMSGSGMRLAPTAQQVSATNSELSAATQREDIARASLHRAEEDLAAVDPAFRSAYEVPSMAELHAMLVHLQKASSAKHKGEAASAALLCFLELPAHGEQAARLVGVLLTSTAAQARQMEFPGLLALAQKFQRYKPLGQRSSATLRRLRAHSADGAQDDQDQSTLDFEALSGELDQLWWSPLAQALGAELVSLKVLHLCSHGIAHQLPYSMVSYLGLGGNVQLFQWPGLPYLRLAYDQAYSHTPADTTANTTSPAPPALQWQIAHDCAWHDEVPLPMVAVEAHLLRQIISCHGHDAQAIEAPAQIHSRAHALVVCSHGTKAQGVNSAVQLRGGDLTTGEVMRRKLGPQIALIPACHAADTADDHAHNALGVAAGFLLSGSKVVVGSIKAVPDTLMPWFSTLLTWYVVHEELGLHAAAVRARQDFGAGAFPEEFQHWVKANLAQALASLHPQSDESTRWGDLVPTAHLSATMAAWPWKGMNPDALAPIRPVPLPTMQAAAQRVANKAFVPQDQTAQKMREMAAFLVVFGLG